jgi:hypothetical protein
LGHYNESGSEAGRSSITARDLHRIIQRVSGDNDYVADTGRGNSMKNYNRLILVGVAVIVFLAGKIAAAETVAETPSEEVKIVAYLDF